MSPGTFGATGEDWAAKEPSDGARWRRLWFLDWSDEVEGVLHREVCKALGVEVYHWRDFTSTEILGDHGRRDGWDDDQYLRWVRRVEEIERELIGGQR